MPARPPAPPEAAARNLRDLGLLLATTRKIQRVSATAASEAAGISRPTLHRIERGESNVSMAAWSAAADALGLKLALVEPHPQGESPLPTRIRLADYPQLKQLAWQLSGVDELGPAEALQLYERNWRHVDRSALSPSEADLIRGLAARFGAGGLLV